MCSDLGEKGGGVRTEGLMGVIRGGDSEERKERKAKKSWGGVKIL